MMTESRDSIKLLGFEAPPGLTFRHFRGPADYAGLAAAGNASPEEIAAIYEHPENWDPATDVIVVEADGEIVGSARGEWWHEPTGLYRHGIYFGLAPAWQGHGVRRALLRWVEARQTQIAAAQMSDAPHVFETGAFQQSTDLIALLERENYRPVHYAHDMVRSLAETIPDCPLPPGLELRPVRPEHYRQIWDASHEAFRDHWGYSPWPEAKYERWLKSPVEFMPELWQVAWDVAKDEVAGQVQTYINAQENEALNRRRGYSEAISVRRPYRRRGLARAIIFESLRTLKAQGMTESALSVDADSLTGATRLYESCGFVVDSTFVVYRKPFVASVA